MENCLRKNVRPMSNCFSLRDPDNIPHSTFSGWRRVGHEYEQDLERTSEVVITGSYSLPLLIGTRAVLFAEGHSDSYDLRDEYRERLFEYAASAAADQLEPLHHTRWVSRSG